MARRLTRLDALIRDAEREVATLSHAPPTSTADGRASSRRSASGSASASPSPDAELPSSSASISAVRAAEQLQRPRSPQPHDGRAAKRLQRRVDELEATLRERDELAALDLEMERRYAAELEQTVKVRGAAARGTTTQLDVFARSGEVTRSRPPARAQHSRTPVPTGA